MSELLHQAENQPPVTFSREPVQNIELYSDVYRAAILGATEIPLTLEQFSVPHNFSTAAQAATDARADGYSQSAIVVDPSIFREIDAAVTELDDKSRRLDIFENMLTRLGSEPEDSKLIPEVVPEPWLGLGQEVGRLYDRFAEVHATAIDRAVYAVGGAVIGCSVIMGVSSNVGTDAYEIAGSLQGTYSNDNTNSDFPFYDPADSGDQVVYTGINPDDSQTLTPTKYTKDSITYKASKKFTDLSNLPDCALDGCTISYQYNNDGSLSAIEITTDEPANLKRLEVQKQILEWRLN